MQRLADWLTVVALLRRYSPQTLLGLGFPDRTRLIVTRFLDGVEARIDEIALLWTNPAVIAVARIVELYPTMRATYLANRLRPIAQDEPAPTHPPAQLIAATTDMFEIERVLNDL
jgi:hypothetical protein